MYMGNKSRTTVGKEDVAIAQSGSEYHASLLFMVVQNSKYVVPVVSFP
jgi:hypothetical protein